MTTWTDWAAAVLDGIKAPRTPTNYATLRGQSTHEKGTWPSTQWNNPLNTTRKWAGSLNSGAQPGPHDVQIYATLADGAAATVATLLETVAGVLPNGYDAIVAALRQGRPAIWWEGTARTQLDTWGTGQGWLNSVPLTEDVMAAIDEIYSMLRVGHTSTGQPSLLQAVMDSNAVQTAILTKLTTIGVGADLSVEMDAIKALGTKLDGIKAESDQILAAAKDVQAHVDKDLA